MPRTGRPPTRDHSLSFVSRKFFPALTPFVNTNLKTPSPGCVSKSMVVSAEYAGLACKNRSLYSVAHAARSNLSLPPTIGYRYNELRGPSIAARAWRIQWTGAPSIPWRTPRGPTSLSLSPPTMGYRYNELRGTSIAARAWRIQWTGAPSIP